MTTAVVFGGAGFIGTHLLERLVTDSVYDRHVSVDIAEPRRPVPGVSYIRGDVREPLPSDIHGGGPSAIFNLAAVHTTPGHADWEYYWTNINGATNVCAFAAATKSNRLTFTSSIAVYGPGESSKDEQSALEPESAYGRSKLMAEQIHRLWRNEGGEHRKLVVIRPAVIYGLGEGGNFTRLARQLRRGRFIYPGRSDTIKSSGYVKDLVSAMLHAERLNEPEVTANFCHVRPYSIKDITEAFCASAGYKVPQKVVPVNAMLAAGLTFEGLAKLGVKTPINRARVLKLFRSTNIEPRFLLDHGFAPAFNLAASLQDWKRSSSVADFD